MNSRTTRIGLGISLCVLTLACGGRARRDTVADGSGGASVGDAGEAQQSTEGEMLTTTASPDDLNDILPDDGPRVDDCSCEHSEAFIDVRAYYPVESGWGGAGGYAPPSETVIGQTYPDPPSPRMLTNSSCGDYQSPAYFQGKCEPTEMAGCVGDPQQFCVHISLEGWSNKVTVTWVNPDGSVQHQKSGISDVTLTTSPLPDSPYSHTEGSFLFSTEEGVTVKGWFDVCYVGERICLG